MGHKTGLFKFKIQEQTTDTSVDNSQLNVTLTMTSSFQMQEIISSDTIQKSTTSGLCVISNNTLFLRHHRKLYARRSKIQASQPMQWSNQKWEL